MTVFDLFSKRQKRERGEVPDVYVYDDLPKQLRGQIVHIIQRAFGWDYFGERAFNCVNDALCWEYGVPRLIGHPESNRPNTAAAVVNFFLAEQSVEKSLDVVELCFQFIHENGTGTHTYQQDEAISDLNMRFKEHGAGYQFEAGHLIRIDSEFLHAEAVKPALEVLHDPDFKGANKEFLKAHEHYRHGRYMECLVDALKSFESTMKTICALRGWHTQPTHTANKLIDTCISNNLFPPYLHSQFSSVRSLLESGIPTLRNRSGGHGQGATPVRVPEYLARYALNLTATTILFLMEAYRSPE